MITGAKRNKGIARPGKLILVTGRGKGSRWAPYVDLARPKRGVWACARHMASIKCPRDAARGPKRLGVVHINI